MPFSIIETGENQYRLDGQLDFTTARVALSEVGEIISRHSHTILDLAGVTQANSAGLALLVEWRAQATKTQKTVSFENMPDSLAKIAVVCQVDGLLQ